MDYIKMIMAVLSTFSYTKEGKQQPKAIGTQKKIGML